MNKKEKNIVLFAPSIHTGGGTERVLVNLANELLERGYNISIYVNVIGENKIYKINENIPIKLFRYGRVVSLYSSNLILKIINKLFGIYFVKYFLKKNLSREIIAIITFSPPITIQCSKTQFLDKVIAFEHWPNWIYDRTPKTKAEINTAYPNLKRVIVLTKHEADVYRKMGCNVEIIPNAYSFCPKDKTDLTRKKVLSIGHFNNQKRRDLLVKAWALVYQEHTDWNLIIVGDGEQKKETIDLIKKLGVGDSIQIIDPTHNILDYYLNASIFVLSSEYESFSLVLQEAKICGLPCVSFDVISGPSELIDNNNDGFLIPFPNVNEMANKINLLIENPKIRKEFGNKAREDIKKRFEPERIYNKWDNLLKNIAM